MKVIKIFVLLSLTIFLASCSEDAEPLPSVVHPSTWNVKGVENFHGNKVLEVGADGCQSCHGEDYTGGESGIACMNCHQDYPHPTEWSAPGNVNSHAAYIKDELNWSLIRCKTCHGNDYSGGSSGVACDDCHKQPGGPEACNTCHGTGAASVSNLVNWAPPKDLDNNLDTSSPGVGAHQAHLKAMRITSAFEQDCNLCHVELSGFDDPNHINGQLNIEFAPIATWNGKVSPVYQTSNYNCSNVYCHGNFTFNRNESANPEIYNADQMTGNNPTVSWTTVGSGLASCGTCHGIPPTGHVVRSDCSSCHYTVVDENYNIIGKDKHINGFIDVY